MKEKRLGRPPTENPATKVIPPIRVHQEELDEYKAAAKRKNLTLSAWVRKVLGRAAKRT